MGTTKTKSGQQKKIKRSFKALQSKKSELKEERKKLNKKIKKASSKDVKKKKIKELKSELKRILKKEEKAKEKLKRHKAKLSDLDKSRSNGQKKKKSQKADPQNRDKTIVHKENPDEALQNIISNISKPFVPENNSIDVNAKTAISTIRKISDINILGEFISRETRTTVQSAAKSRRNAIIRLENRREEKQ